jgi:hypothetical protein
MRHQISALAVGGAAGRVVSCLATMALAGAGLTISAPARAQEVRAALVPDTLPLSGGMENAARLRTREDSVDGAARVTAIYFIAPWRPGAAVLPKLDGRVVDPGGGARTFSVALPTLAVRSVLPADTAGVKPKPPRDVLGPDRLWWPPLLVIAGVLLVLMGLYWWWRERRQGPVMEPMPQLTPRQRALAALDHVRTLGLLEAGEAKAFYSLVTEALRRYLAELDGTWGEDLTTREVVGRMARASRSADVRELRDLLDAADLVKFARRKPGRVEAEAEWARVRRWVARFGPPAPAPEQAA